MCGPLPHRKKVKKKRKILPKHCLGLVTALHFAQGKIHNVQAYKMKKARQIRIVFKSLKTTPEVPRTSDLNEPFKEIPILEAPKDPEKVLLPAVEQYTMLCLYHSLFNESYSLFIILCSIFLMFSLYSPYYIMFLYLTVYYYSMHYIQYMSAKYRNVYWNSCELSQAIIEGVLWLVQWDSGVWFLLRSLKTVFTVL